MDPSTSVRPVLRFQCRARPSRPRPPHSPHAGLPRNPLVDFVREIFRVVHSSWQAGLSPPSTPGSAALDVDKQPGPPRVQPPHSARKNSDPPATVSEKSRRGTAEQVDSGGVGAGGGGGSVDGTPHTVRGSLSRKRSVLSTQSGTAAADENREASPPQGSLAGATPAGRAASVTTPVSATINGAPGHDTRASIQDTKAVEQSTLATNLQERLAAGQKGIAGVGGGGHGGGGGAGDRRTEEGEEDGTRISIRSEEAVLSVPRSELLRALRQSGLLRRKAMTSDAVRPILCDRDFTEVSVCTLFHVQLPPIQQGPRIGELSYSAVSLNKLEVLASVGCCTFLGRAVHCNVVSLTLLVCERQPHNGSFFLCGRGTSKALGLSGLVRGLADSGWKQRTAAR